MKKKNKKFNFVFNSDVDLEGNSIKIFLKKKIFSIFTYLKKLRKNFENIERSKKIEGNKVFFKDNDNNFFLDLEKFVLASTASICKRHLEHLPHPPFPSPSEVNLIVSSKLSIAFHSSIA